MAAINLQDVAKAQKDFADARNQALQAASPQSGSGAPLAAQQSALLSYLQTRVRLLSDAKANAMREFDDTIAELQMRIGELNQQMQESSQSADAPPTTEVGQQRRSNVRTKRKDG